MTVEAALVTRKNAANEFNTDSINASGKTWPRETVHGEKGIKAVGTGKDVPYYVLASSPVKGTAESAADLFKSCTQIFAPDMSNCAGVISDFYTSFAKVLNDAGYSSADCELEVFCGYGDNVVIAKSGGAKLYKITGTQIEEIVPDMGAYSDGNSSFGVCVIGGVKENDIFVMINSAVADVLPGDLVNAIAESANGDIKKIASVLASQAEKYGCRGAVSAIVVRVTQTESLAAAPFVPETKTEGPVRITEEPEEEAPVEIPQNDEGTKVPVEEKSRGKVAFGIVIAVFLLFLVILGFVAGRGIAGRHKIDGTTTTEESTSVEETTTTEETTTGETTTEETTTEETTSEEETELAETTTRSETTTRTVSTTAAPETTKSDVTEEPGSDATENEPSDEATSAEEEPSEVTEPEEGTEEPATAPEDTDTGEKEEVLG